MILGVPIIDVLFAIIRRIATPGLSITAADKDHLHHRLLRLGHGHRRVVFILWTWTALLSGFVLWPTYSGRGDGIVPMGRAGGCLILFTLLHPRLQINKPKKNEIVAEDRSPALGACEKEARFTCGRIFKFSRLSNLNNKL